MAKNEQAVPGKEQVEQRERKWLKPTKRAAGYAEARTQGVHMRGPKKGQELDPYIRMAKLNCILRRKITSF